MCKKIWRCEFPNSGLHGLYSYRVFSLVAASLNTRDGFEFGNMFLFMCVYVDLERERERAYHIYYVKCYMPERMCVIRVYG